MLKYDIAEKSFQCDFCKNRIFREETFVEGDFDGKGNIERRCYPACQIGSIMCNNMKKPEGTPVIRDGKVVIQK